MNAVAAIKWTLAKVQQQGPDITLAELDEQLASDSLPAADQQECREWLDGMLTQKGRQFGALDALLLKLTTIGAAITQRLNHTALEKLTVDEISRLMEAYLDFKKVIEHVVPKQ